MGVKGLTVTDKNQDFSSSYNHTTQLNDFTRIVYFMPVSWWRQGEKNNDPWTGEVELRDNRSTSRGGVGYRVKNLSPPQSLNKNKKLLNIYWFVPALILCGRYLLVSFCGEERLLKVILLLQKVSKILSKMDKYPISPSLKLKHHTNSYLQVALLFLRLSLEPLFSPVSFFLLLLFLLVSLHIFCDLGVVDSSCLAERFGDTSLSLSTQLNFIQKWENKAVTRQ